MGAILSRRPTPAIGQLTGLATAGKANHPVTTGPVTELYGQIGKGVRVARPSKLSPGKAIARLSELQDRQQVGRARPDSSLKV